MYSMQCISHSDARTLTHLVVSEAPLLHKQNSQHSFCATFARVLTGIPTLDFVAATGCSYLVLGSPSWLLSASGPIAAGKSSLGLT